MTAAPAYAGGMSPPQSTSKAANGRTGTPLGLLVFTVGAAALGVEIAAVRLLAPYFGASEVVWANTIGVVLVALSIGYWLGGRVADRRPYASDLCATVMLAAVLTAAVPFVARPLLSAGVAALDSVSAGAFAGSLLATLTLVALPVLVMGAVAPWALRIGIDAGGAVHAGTLAGRLYALSTAGSLVGTIGAALVLVPGLGTRRTFLVFALAMAGIALPGMTRRPRFAVVPLAIAAVLLLPNSAIKIEAANGRVIHERETALQYARVVAREDGSRALELNEGQAIHSLFRPETVLTGDYWDTALVLPMAGEVGTVRRVAVLGNAAGTIARAYLHYFPEASVDGVDVDSELAEIGRRFFGLGGDRFRAHGADARPFLRSSHTRFDVIVLDAYRQPYIPFYLTTKEFFALARERLRPGGTVVVNVGHPEGDRELERVLATTMRTSFAHVMSSATQPTNTMLVASSEPLSAKRMLARAAREPDLAEIARREATLLRPAPRAGNVYTDDRAPVEWLIDRSIVRYAAGE